MTQFASIWAVKSDTLVSEGQTILVKTKAGAIKEVKVEKFLYSQEYKDGRTAHFYLPAREREDA